MDEIFVNQPKCSCFSLHESNENKSIKKLHCCCEEEEDELYEWIWENNSCSNIVLSNGNRDVLFHPIYSTGTAAIKGESPFKRNLYYYWEIKILTDLYGTDVMIGVGTSNLTMSDWKLKFCSMLGYNMESWGYSYTGKIQHNKLKCSYGPHFSIGSLIGVYLNMCNGTLEYYLNRKPLGIAFRNLKNYQLYPMVCSTAAQSAMRITCSLSQAPSLQIECLKVIAKHIILLRHLYTVPGIMRTIKKKYFWLIPPQVEDEEVPLDLEDECVLPFDTLNQNTKDRRIFCSSLTQLRMERQLHWPTYSYRNCSTTNTLS
ncbi:hypothetical protein FQR65_LT17313 [Abscondita terminalis]|nr:hypothetical protein FQR65_LT17313 [Abscondita terminalis]